MNLPDYDEANLSFGPGVVYLSAVGTTPSSDVGAVNKGMELSHETEVMAVEQGSVEYVIKEFRGEETAIFSFTGFEWKLSNFDQYLGAGHVNGDEFSYGGDIQFVEASLRLVHDMPISVMPSGYGEYVTRITIDIWRARSDGDLDIDFSDEWHDFPLDFLALPASEDWSGNPLVHGEEFYRITLVKGIVGVTQMSVTLPMTAELFADAGPVKSPDEISMSALLELSVI